MRGTTTEHRQLSPHISNPLACRKCSCKHTRCVSIAENSDDGSGVLSKSEWTGNFISKNASSVKCCYLCAVGLSANQSTATYDSPGAMSYSRMDATGSPQLLPAQNDFVMAPASLLMSASESAFPSSQAELEFDFQVHFHSIAMLKQSRAQSADFEVHALAQ